MTRSVWHGRRPGRHAVAITAAFVVTAGAALAAPRVTVAQAVRVTTVSAATGAEVPNALLTAVDARDTTVAVTTTALQGSRLVPVPQVGTYRFVVRRIGQRPFTSAPVVVGTRDTVAVTLRLPTAPVLLSAVRVTSGASCVGGRGHEAPEVTALWDQIRTAVRLVSLQEADSAPAAEVRRFVTRLDADGRTVLAHTVLPPERGRVYLFGTAAPETLATRGYVRRTDTTTTYTVPDGPTLLSDAFARDHCFNLVAGADSAPGLVGLAFTPTRGRRVPEVAGVLWADTATAALRALTFRYVAPGGASGWGGGGFRFDTLSNGTRRLVEVVPERASGRAPRRPEDGWGGGEVRFDTLPGGTWTLSAWRLRTPSVEIGAVATPALLAAGPRPGLERTAAARAADASAATSGDAGAGEARVARLPTDPPGADPPWRVDTRAGLARLAGRVRDGAVAVHVQDARGRPVGGATVALAQQADPAGAAWVITDGSTRVRLAHAAGTLAKTTADGSAVVALPPGRYLVRVALPSPAGDVQPPVTAVRVTPDARAALTVAAPTLASLATRCPAPARADTDTRTGADSSATRLVYGTVVDERAWASWAPGASARGAGPATPGADTAAPPVGGARVRAVWADGATGRDASRSAQATTDGEGHFVLCGVPRTATPRITAEAPDGPSASWAVALGPAPRAAASTRVALWPSATRAATSGLPAPPTDPFTVVVDRAVSGVVYDSLRHRPLPGAAVQLARAGDLLGRRAVVADSAGAFRIDALAPGRYVVGFDHPLLDLLPVEVPPRLVELGPGSDAVRVDLGLPDLATLRPAWCGSAQAPNDSTGVLAGRVRDAADGAPVARATVVLTWSELAFGAGVHRERRRVSVPTGPGGTYLACGVPAGVELAASAAAPGRASGEVAVEVPPRGFAVRDLSLGDTGAVAAVAAPDADPTARPEADRPVRGRPRGGRSRGRDTATVAVARGTARLTGTVRDPAGRSVRAARVFVWGTGAAATAGDDGTFALAGLPAGTRTLEVRAVGFAPRRVAVDLAPGRTGTVEVQLERTVASLDSVTIFGTPSERSAAYNEFLDRRRRNAFGRFVTGEDLRRWHPTQVSTALGSVPGVQVTPGRLGNTILGRGKMGAGSCPAVVVLDGTALEQDDVIDWYVRPEQVAGIEVYAEAAFAPPQYGGARRNGCSVVLVWTR